MKITRFSGGPVPTNCYILTDESTGSGAVVDPGFESDELSEAVRKAGDIRAILLTHGHYDHISGVCKIKELTGAKIYLYSDELLFVNDPSLNLAGMMFGEELKPFRVDVPLNDGETVDVGGLKIRVLHTPGHTIGGCCYLVEDAVFSGDTLMKLSCGRTDCPTGSYAQMMDSLRRLASLPGDRRIFPGHGSPTTLDYERKNNVYLGQG